MRIGIIGKGRVGTAVAEGLMRARHEVRFGHRDPKENVRDAAEWGEVIFIAVPFGAVKDVSREISPQVRGKTIIDVTNVIEPAGLTVGLTTSGA